MSGMSVPSTTSATSWRIAEVARLVDLTPRAIRHYEGMGLLRPSRSKGAYRLYDDADVERLRTIRSLRDDAGLSIADIRELLEDDQHTLQARQAWEAARTAQDRVALRRIAMERIERLDRRIALLEDKVARLTAMADDARARRTRARTTLQTLEAGLP